MADNTKIEWADATLNYVNGCSVISPGCTNCYAMRAGGRNLPGHPSTGLTMPTKAGHVWTGEIRLSENALMQALRWKRGRRIFWNAHGDLFHENVPDEAIDRLFAVCALTPQHTHMILTKRSARMRQYVNDLAVGGRMACDYVCHVLAEMPDGGYNTALAPNQDFLRASLGRCGGSPQRPYTLPNVWLGVSVEDQQRADERILDLMATLAAVRLISGEPLLGPINLTCLPPLSEMGRQYGLTIDALKPGGLRSINWVIVGGESGKGARPMHPNWVRSLRDQCAAAGVPFFFKQWGDYLPGGQMMADGKVWQGNRPLRAIKKMTGRLLDGRTHDELPA